MTQSSEQFNNYLNKAPLPKPVIRSPQVEVLDVQESQIFRLAKAPETGKHLRHLPCAATNLDNLLREIKTLFFYDDPVTLRQELRHLVQGYQKIAQSCCMENETCQSV